MTSLLPTIEAKSDQLNAEDLVGGPRTVSITGVKVSASDDQPVWISFEGDNGKPFKPCKTVRRLLVRVWGDDSNLYAGRSMTLYLDPEVKYGGMKVGGIRVSHVSHINGPQSFFTSVSRGKKAQITVRPLDAEVKKMPRNGPTLEDALTALDAAKDLDALKGAWSAFAEFQEDPRFVASKDARKVEISQQGDGF